MERMYRISCYPADAPGGEHGLRQHMLLGFARRRFVLTTNMLTIPEFGHIACSLRAEIVGFVS
jgi:hypothetical protein